MYGRVPEQGHLRLTGDVLGSKEVITDRKVDTQGKENGRALVAMGSHQRFQCLIMLVLLYFKNPNFAALKKIDSKREWGKKSD